MSAYSDLILGETALQSYWRLNEASGPTVVDSEGAVDGTIVDNVSLNQASLLLGDPDDKCALWHTPAGGCRIDCGDFYPFTGTANFSVEAWIKPDADALAANAFVISNVISGGADGWTFRILAAGGFRLARVVSSASDNCQSDAGEIVANTTYHIVGTYDGSTMRIYKNGLEKANLPSTQSLIDPAATLTLGSAPGGGNYCTGYIDEVAIYNDDLAAASVLEHYETGISTQVLQKKIQVVRSNLRW